jgi:hypothetical protein
MAVLATLYCHGRSSQLRSAVVRPLCCPYRIEQRCACTVLPRLERSCAKVALARPNLLAVATFLPTCLYRKPKSVRNGDEAPRGWRVTRCSRPIERDETPMHLCPTTGVFGFCCNSRHKFSGSGAGAPRPRRRYGRRTHAGSSRKRNTYKPRNYVIETSR